jgi:hypothetical protein
MHEAASSEHVLSSASEDAITAHARTLRAVIESIPAAHRPQVLAKVADLLPNRDAREPRRGGPLLNNVYRLYKEEPTPKGAADVVKALQEDGVKVGDSKPVYNAINYLRRARVLRKVGYGMYQLDDGSIVDIPS